MRILLTATAVALALPMLLPPPATADLAIHIEDFEHNGEPGFDPGFAHQFFVDEGGTLMWEISDEGYGWWGDPMLVIQGRTTAAISSGLNSSESVVSASVDVIMGVGMGGTTVTFVGERMRMTYSHWHHEEEPITLSARSADIGEIRINRL